MKVLSFDLELNQDPKGAKIIEIGACVGDIKTAEICESYSAIVNPHESLVEAIIKLTGITQVEVDQGVTVDQAYLGMEALARKHECLTLPLVWGGGDGHAVRKELSSQCKWSFGRRELDVKAVFQAHQMAQGEKVQAGLAKALTKLGLVFKGKKHRALDDAINTFIIYCKLLNQFKPKG